jgi:hypothetical protein
MLQNEALVSSPGLVWGTRWSQIWIRWGEGYISMGKESNSTPLISEEYQDKAGLLGVNPGAFNYYSISGEGGMWSISLCDTGRSAVTCATKSTVWVLKFNTRWGTNMCCNFGYIISHTLLALVFICYRRKAFTGAKHVTSSSCCWMCTIIDLNIAQNTSRRGITCLNKLWVVLCYTIYMM